MQTAALEFDASIFDRLIVPHDNAESVLAIRFSPEDEHRLQELVDKNNKGTITDKEKVEMESYRRAGTLLSILQAKARLQINNDDALS